MKAEGFIAARIRFKGRMASLAIAISFFIIIISVTIADGFRREIRSGLSSISGDVQLTSPRAGDYADSDPVSCDISYMDKLLEIDGVESISPAIYKAGIVKSGDVIHGVFFKGTEDDSLSLSARIPSRLARILRLEEGDKMLTYFVGEKVKVRKFTVAQVYDSVLEGDDNLMVFVPIDDLRRLNSWEKNEASALEVSLSASCKSPAAIKEKAAELGNASVIFSSDEEDSLLSVPVSEKYSQLFDWLSLIDFNVYVILLLMTVVAGFNMISGLLILLFRSMSTIGMLKAMGMTDRSIAGVFIRVSARLVAFGVLAGNAVALLFCLVQDKTHLLKLNPENYFVSYVPVSVDISSVLLWDAIAFAGIMILLLIPCMFISRIDPARTMRQE